jgi:HAD superfamily hydrolase (TIGR01509 family)
MPQANIRLITIDLDDTLWPCRPPLEAAEQALLAWLQSRAAALAARHDLASLKAHRLELRTARPELAHDLTALRRASLRELLSGAGYPLPQAVALAEEGVALFLAYRNRVQPYPDASPGLRRLAGRYCLIALTNGNADVERTPLRNHFHHAFQAGDVGAAKPDPALFHAALAQAGVRPDQALHLGDDPHLDVAAARRCGMGAVWLDRHGAPWPADLPFVPPRVTDLFHFLHWLEHGP